MLLIHRPKLNIKQVFIFASILLLCCNYALCEDRSSHTSHQFTEHSNSNTALKSQLYTSPSSEVEINDVGESYNEPVKFMVIDASNEQAPQAKQVDAETFQSIIKNANSNSNIPENLENVITNSESITFFSAEQLWNFLNDHPYLISTTGAIIVITLARNHILAYTLYFLAYTGLLEPTISDRKYKFQY